MERDSQKCCNHKVDLWKSFYQQQTIDYTHPIVYVVIDSPHSLKIQALSYNIINLARCFVKTRIGSPLFSLSQICNILLKCQQRDSNLQPLS